MSDIFNNDSDGLDFNDRTTRDSFNERLMKAREDSERDQNSRIDFNDFYTSDDPEALNQQLKQLQKQVSHMETQVNQLETKLTTRRERRAKEASLTNLSPEERADVVAQQERDIEEGETPDLDVIFEYLLLLGSSTEDDIGDLSTNDFLQPHEGIRKKALESSMVKRQERYSNIHFIEANNVLDSNPNIEGEIRHCELKGKAYDEEFTLTFDVLEPSMEMSNLMYDVDIEMNLAIGDILEMVKEECNLLGFFRLLTHYGLLGRERKSIFEKLVNKYKGTEVNVEELSETRLKFEGGPDYEAYFILEWKTKLIYTSENRLDANVTDHVQPDISLEAVKSKAVNERDTHFHLGRINEKFIELVKLKGVYMATEIVINKVLMP